MSNTATFVVGMACLSIRSGAQSVDIEVLFDHVIRVLATRPFYPCVLLVDHDVRRVQSAGEQLALRAGWPQVAVSRVLAERLSEVPEAQRSLAADGALDGTLADHRPGPVLCTDLALLFEPALALDSLALLRRWSRSVSLVACWPGAVTAAGLAYAVPEHAHYRVWKDTQLRSDCVVDLAR